MLSIIIYIIFILIFICCPFPAQLILLLINVFVPDPIPVLDEVIMGISMLKKLNNIASAVDFFKEHPVLAVFAGIAVIVLLVLVIRWIF